MLETLGLGRVYAITCLKVVILIRKRLCSRLVQEPRSQVIPGLRYKAMCEMWSIIGRLRYLATYWVVLLRMMLVTSKCGEMN